MLTDNHITVFEHDRLLVGNEGDNINPEQLAALQRFYGNKGVPYYSLINNGIKFCEYVGVINVGPLTIEVLPKADRQHRAGSDFKQWQKILIGMLKSVGAFQIHAPTTSHLHLKANSILDLYIELFVIEVEYLLRRGLIKKYQKKENNSTALKGRLMFNKHLLQNLLTKDRFYVEHNVYDVENLLNSLVYHTLTFISTLNSNVDIGLRIQVLMLQFPDQKKIRVNETTFSKFKWDRKTMHYKPIIEIARLLLLNYHPDVSQGSNSVLALMFDMNMLWEQFIFVSLKRHIKDYDETEVLSQVSKTFWTTKNDKVNMRPDIVVSRSGRTMVLDTKWKNLNGYNPSPDDLRQLYVYQEYFNAVKVALVFPGEHKPLLGFYANDLGQRTNIECAVLHISVVDDIPIWQEKIGSLLINWFDNGNK